MDVKGDDVDDLDAHARAQRVFADVLARVRPDQWDAPTPCAQWDVITLVEHVIGGNQRVQLLAGRDAVELPDDDPVERHRRSAAGAQGVFAADDGLTRAYELPIGPIPGSVFVGIRTGDVVTHAWDLARATGQPTDLDPELAAAALETSRQRIVPALRGPDGFFGHEQPCPPDRPVADQLAAFLGRVV